MSTEHSRFLLPNTTQIPDVLLDKFMPRLNGAAFKIVMYVCRRTYGFKKEADHISVDQMVNGIKKRDGTVLDEGTGLGRSTVIEECAKLVKVGLLNKNPRKREDGKDEAPTYTLNLALSPKPKGPNKPRGKHVSKGEGPKSGPPKERVQNLDGGRVQNLDPQHPVDTTPSKVPSVGKQVSDQEDRPAKAKRKARSAPDDDFRALRDDEYKERSRKIIEGAGDLGGKLTSIIRLAAQENKTRRIAASRVYNEFCEPFDRDRAEFSDEAWAHGFDAAISKGVGNLGYAKKAARRYHMAHGAQANGIDPTELGGTSSGGTTPQRPTATPQAGIEALRNYENPKTGSKILRKFASLAERHDFTSDDRPPDFWKIEKEISKDPAERERFITQIQSIVRRAVREQEAS